MKISVSSLVLGISALLHIVPSFVWADAHEFCNSKKDKFGNIEAAYLPPVDDFAPDVVPLANEHIEALSVPIYHSKPSSTKKIFLDFDGQVISGTPWNSRNDNLPIHAPPYTTDGDLTTFTSSELTNIEIIWKRVSEDFAPYNVDVTTEDPGSAAFSAGSTAIRALISTDIDEVAVGGVQGRRGIRMLVV